MATLQQQARALGDPTRHEIFRYLLAASGPVDVAALTAHVALNHNAVRQHLAKLVAAELVEEATVRGGGPGRPRYAYRVAPAAQSRWGPEGPYERLSQLLVEMIATGDGPVAVGLRAGRRYRAGTPASADPVADLADVMERHGFDPVVQRKGRRAEVVLGTCPFASAAETDAGTVCALHLGIVQGFFEDSGFVVDDLVAKDPRRAHCRVRLRPEGLAAVN
ncbi:MAG: helix-turn-helix transcriptional regulator [Acidimicrobiales bacterium]